MWRSTTTNLTTLTHRCSPVMMNSHNNTDPAMYDDKEWIGAAVDVRRHDGVRTDALGVPGLPARPGWLLHPQRRAVRREGEVLAERDHPRHVDQRRVDLLAHDAAEPSGRRLSDPLGAR